MDRLREFMKLAAAVRCPGELCAALQPNAAATKDRPPDVWLIANCMRRSGSTFEAVRLSWLSSLNFENLKKNMKIFVQWKQ